MADAPVDGAIERNPADCIKNLPPGFDEPGMGHLLAKVRCAISQNPVTVRLQVLERELIAQDIDSRRLHHKTIVARIGHVRMARSAQERSAFQFDQNLVIAAAAHVLRGVGVAALAVARLLSLKRRARHFQRAPFDGVEKGVGARACASRSSLPAQA
jgi:hypothetical protein